MFTIEALMKIVALGFIMGETTYLKFAWNVMDFVIVISGLTEIVGYYTHYEGFNMRILRLLRILRPMKAMKTIPSLRK